jgi:hypothetical protein
MILLMPMIITTQARNFMRLSSTPNRLCISWIKALKSPAVPWRCWVCLIQVLTTLGVTM